MHDLIIIGGGAAGMTAAVYAVRKKLDIMVVTRDIGGQMLWTRDIENYMGFQYITGPELIGKFEEHVKNFPVPIEYDEVVNLARTGDGCFTLQTAEKSYRGKTVIIASGKRPRRLNVPGEENFTGRGVGYCATCDGPLYGGKTVAVVGGGNSAVQAVIELAGIAQKVYLIARGELRADPIIIDKMTALSNAEVLSGYRIERIEGGERVEKAVVTNGKESGELGLQGIFVEIGLDPNSEFARGVTKLNSFGEIVIDCRTRTGVPGLFAAGDVSSGPDKQIIVAAGDGAKAAICAYEYLMFRK